jgi:hypothetical protein
MTVNPVPSPLDPRDATHRDILQARTHLVQAAAHLAMQMPNAVKPAFADRRERAAAAGEDCPDPTEGEMAEYAAAVEQDELARTLRLAEAFAAWVFRGVTPDGQMDAWLARQGDQAA